MSKKRIEIYGFPVSEGEVYYYAIVPPEGYPEPLGPMKCVADEHGNPAIVSLTWWEAFVYWWTQYHCEIMNAFWDSVGGPWSEIDAFEGPELSE